MKLTKRNRKFLAVILSFVLILALAGTSFAYGTETKEEVESELEEIKDEQDATSAELQRVEREIKSLEGKVKDIETSIKTTSAEISGTETKIAAKEAEMAEQEESLNARLRVMYKNGSIGFLDVLLGSGSVSEMISNMELIQRIYENDIEVMEKLQIEHDELEKIKEELKAKKVTLSQQQDNLAEEQKALDAKKSVLEEREDELNAQAKALETELLNWIDVEAEYVGGAFIWPVPSSHYITSYQGYRMHPVLNIWKYHSGMDIGANTGAAIVAAGSGTVILSQYYGGYGYCVMIDHGGGIVSLYGHASALYVSAGQQVTQGQTIAAIGSTGISSGPHLHFEVRENGVVVDPLNYL